MYQILQYLQVLKQYHGRLGIHRPIKLEESPQYLSDFSQSELEIFVDFVKEICSLYGLKETRKCGSCDLFITPNETHCHKCKVHTFKTIRCDTCLQPKKLSSLTFDDTPDCNSICSICRNKNKETQRIREEERRKEDDINVSYTAYTKLECEAIRNIFILASSLRKIAPYRIKTCECCRERMFLIYSQPKNSHYDNQYSEPGNDIPYEYYTSGFSCYVYESRDWLMGDLFNPEYDLPDKDYQNVDDRNCLKCLQLPRCSYCGDPSSSELIKCHRGDCQLCKNCQAPCKSCRQEGSSPCPKTTQCNKSPHKMKAYDIPCVNHGSRYIRGYPCSHMDCPREQFVKYDTGRQLYFNSICRHFIMCKPCEIHGDKYDRDKYDRYKYCRCIICIDGDDIINYMPWNRPIIPMN